MNLKRELLFAVGVLVVLNLALAFGAIGLFVRMGPAIERIITENVYSIVAVEEVLVELATSEGTPLPPASIERIEQALDNAEKNVTESEEKPVMGELRRAWPKALAGDVAEKKRFVANLEKLLAINRSAMQRTDGEARRLGQAGAWAAVLIGFATFLLSLHVLFRLEKRFVKPLLDLHGVLEDAKQGAKLRRCRSAIQAPVEVVQVAQAVNELLDERLDSHLSKSSL